MKNILFVVLLASVLLLPSAFVSTFPEMSDRPYVETSKEISLKDFNALKISGASTASVQTGDFKIVVTGDEVDLGDLKPSVQNGVFSYMYARNNVKRFGLKFEISMPALTDVNLSGASKMEMNSVSSDAFTATISGASSFKTLNSTLKNAKLDVSGASNATFSVSDVLTANVSGASSLMANSNATKKVNIVVTGASKGRVSASETLSAEASGASSIYYRGNPAILKNKTSGASKITKEW